MTNQTQEPNSQDDTSVKGINEQLMRTMKNTNEPNTA